MNLSKLNSVTLWSLYLVFGLGLGLGWLMDLEVGQLIVFAVGFVLFSVWIFSQTGTPTGILSENVFFGLLLSVVFIAAALWVFTDGFQSGNWFPERPLSFFISVFTAFPYCLRSILELFD